MFGLNLSTSPASKVSPCHSVLDHVLYRTQVRSDHAQVQQQAIACQLERRLVRLPAIKPIYLEEGDLGLPPNGYEYARRGETYWPILQ